MPIRADLESRVREHNARGWLRVNVLSVTRVSRDTAEGYSGGYSDEVTVRIQVPGDPSVTQREEAHGLRRALGLSEEGPDPRPMAVSCLVRLYWPQVTSIHVEVMGGRGTVAEPFTGTVVDTLTVVQRLPDALSFLTRFSGGDPPPWIRGVHTLLAQRGQSNIENDIRRVLDEWAYETGYWADMPAFHGDTPGLVTIQCGTFFSQEEARVQIEELRQSLLRVIPLGVEIRLDGRVDDASAFSGVKGSEKRPTVWDVLTEEETLGCL